MTSKFIIPFEDILLDHTTIEEDILVYEENYKELGYDYDKESGNLYMITDKELNLQEGDKIYMPCLTVCKITHKQYDFSSHIMEYYLDYT